jgi:hypothetical protein
VSLAEEHQTDDTPDLLQPLRDQWGRLRKYRTTKTAIRRGVPTWELSAAQLKAQGLSGPWEQEILESAFAALPALLLLKVLHFLFAEREEVALTRATLSEVVRLRADIFQYLTPFITPLCLLAAVVIASRASLKAADSTPERRRLAKRAYLYLDGSYGLAPQAFISLIIAALSTVAERKVPGDKVSLLLILFVLWQLVSIWQLWIIGRTLPQRLFQMNGYDTKVPHLWSRKAGHNYGPWSKYTLAIVFLGPIVVLAIFALAFGVAHVSAIFGVWLRGLTSSL